MDKKNVISIHGAREHNLKNISLTIPKNALVVITGPSGSGKSSLALDTLYAEGRRRYVESLSSYARQFLGVTKKPDVDRIDGLAPAIAIDQKTVGYNPRSTVGTITEIYDYLRVLFARAGTPHCPSCNLAIKAESPQTIAELVLQNYQTKEITWGAPLAIQRKGEFTHQLEAFFKRGYHRFYINGTVHRFSTVDDITKLHLKKTYQHTIYVILDRCTVSFEERVRVQEAIEKAFTLTQGFCVALWTNEAGEEQTELYAADRICVNCGSSFPELEPRLFSFNSPLGACKSCHGLGFVYVAADEQEYTGMYAPRYAHHTKTCGTCQGSRLRPEAQAVLIKKASIVHLSHLSIDDLFDFFQDLTIDPALSPIIGSLVQEITHRLGFLRDVGLSYLTLSRTARTLSGGEGQRIRLATQIGSPLSGVLYVLDEPSIGLHQRDNDKLITTLKKLRDYGNTVLVVEHDVDTIKASDWVIDIGPAAGVLGGKIVAADTPGKLASHAASLTGAYLSGKKEIPVPTKRRKAKGFLVLSGASTHNLQKINVTIPLGCFVGVSGVSGSGKSSLVMYTLAPALTTYFSQGFKPGGNFDDIQGMEQLANCVLVDQSPIGRTPRSNPATYLGIFDEIRALFAKLPESNARGYDAGRFSFNVAKGRCSKCRGEGKIVIEMHFLEDVEIECKTCKGQRYSPQTLEITYNGKNIAEILSMTVHEATAFFEHFPRIKKRLSLLCEVGLDYIKLGQPSTTLSGGEAQRIKLVNELAKRGNNTLYILDEPTTGLHMDDVKKLLLVLERLVDQGNSVLVIEHNLDVLKTVDYLIDIGPEGGIKGGTVVASGTPEAVTKVKASITGRYLKPYLSL